MISPPGEVGLLPPPPPPPQAPNTNARVRTTAECTGLQLTRFQNLSWHRNSPSPQLISMATGTSVMGYFDAHKATRRPTGWDRLTPMRRVADFNRSRGLLLLASVATLAGAQEEPQPSRLEIAPSDLETVREDWYGIYSGENKLGYMKTLIRPQEGSVAVENEMRLKVVTMGEKRDISSSESIVFAAEQPYELLHGSGTTAQGAYEQTVRIEPGEEGFAARITAGGTERTMDLGQVDYTLADVLAPEIWFRGEREVGDAISARSFSLSELRPSIDTYTVKGLKETRLDGVLMAYYEVILHSSVGGEIGTALIDENGDLVSGVLGGAFELRRETAETATDFDYSADVYLLGLAEIDRGLGDPREVSTLVMEIAGADTPEIPNSSHQTLSFDEASETWTLSIGQGSGEPQPANPEDIEAALEETVEHPIYDSRIVELASKVTDGCRERDRQGTEAGPLRRPLRGRQLLGRATHGAGPAGQSQG